ncbi:MAG TPA: AAA family ATPase [Actinocrinis sp.]|jgi:hypothetical protein|uniref:AAA family ATPase n=1 Tax=Actinocrinis sp. TaxID=1920516 RepID=UPI002DDD7275|nr:AAA family ATPase [Actinocrinis sp.]HEV3170836.1 AAA family ATPase [Actinocrinis sp.]
MDDVDPWGIIVDDDEVLEARADADAALAGNRNPIPADAGDAPETVFERAVTGLLDELLDSDGLDHIPRLEPVIDGFLYRDTLARIIGPSGHMKSFVALDFAGHVGGGHDWRGFRVVKGPVVYLVAEGGEGIRKRVRAWEQYHGRKMAGVRFLPRPVQAGDQVAWSVLVEVARRIEPALIIFDTQARITVGVEENSSKEMGLVVARMDDLRAATKACVALIHHQGLQGDHGRGSTAVKGAMQTELRVTKKGKKGPEARVIVSSDKQKDDEELDDIAFGIHVVKLDGEAKEDGSPVTSVVLVPADLPAEGQESATGRKPMEGRKARVRVLGILRAATVPMTVKAIGDALAAQDFGSLKTRTIQNALNELSNKQLAEVAGAHGFGQTWRATVGGDGKAAA